MTTVNMPEAQSSLPRLVETVETGAETEIIIARNGRPAVRLMAIKLRETAKRIGVAKGRFIVPDTIDAEEAAITALFTETSGEAAQRHAHRTLGRGGRPEAA